MKIGVLCPSEIAIRRFMPAMHKIQDLEFVGVGVNSINERYGDSVPCKKDVDEMLKSEREKANAFINSFGGSVFLSYEEIVSSSDIDALYVPLPPALHYKWVKKALDYGKHVLVEKPATLSFNDTNDLVQTARNKSLALHENYMFIYHKQLSAIEEIINSGEIGEVRLYRISFGFPRRDTLDFRYNKELGGGALFDAGGYTLKYASRLLGKTAEIKHANLNYIDGFEVDMYGTATLVNSSGLTAQVAFGMDSDYKCELEVWGSKGTLKTGRVLTAPAGLVPHMSIKKNTKIEEYELPSDDSFEKSIKFFLEATANDEFRVDNYEKILNQAKLVDQFLKIVKPQI